MEATTEAEPKVKQLTEYVVLRAVKGPAGEEGIFYAETITTEASSAAIARQHAFEKLSAEDQAAGATFIAVPKRSWQPKRRKLDTKPRSVEE